MCLIFVDSRKLIKCGIYCECDKTLFRNLDDTWQNFFECSEQLYGFDWILRFPEILQIHKIREISEILNILEVIFEIIVVSFLLMIPTFHRNPCFL